MVQVLRAGKTRDQFLGACAHNIWMLTAQADIEVRYSHIPISQNCVVDLLSRWQNSEVQCRVLQDLLPCHIRVNVHSNALEIDPET